MTSPADVTCTHLCEYPHTLKCICGLSIPSDSLVIESNMQISVMLVEPLIPLEQLPL